MSAYLTTKKEGETIMAKAVFSRMAFTAVKQTATRGGTSRATADAEERVKKGMGLDQLVDPKGYGGIRRSLPRFEERPDGKWCLSNGVPMLEETLLDTTGSMGNNVDLAFEALPGLYDLMTVGKCPVLGRYDPQVINACFGDTSDDGTPVLCRSQAEMDVKIAQQLTMLVPSGNGCGNGKEDPQFGLYGAAYLTSASINRYGLGYYHFTISDEPVVETIDLSWLKQIFGKDVLDWAEQNGHTMDAKALPDTAQAVKDLQVNAHAFFVQVASRSDVTEQWERFYGKDHMIMLPGTTSSLHLVKACVIGLTEGVLDLQSAAEFLQEHAVSKKEAALIVRAVSKIPLGKQARCENFAKIPMAGAIFNSKTDLWPIDPSELAAPDKKGKKSKPKPTGPEWL